MHTGVETTVMKLNVFGFGMHRLLFTKIKMKREQRASQDEEIKSMPSCNFGATIHVAVQMMVLLFPLI